MIHGGTIENKKILMEFIKEINDFCKPKPPLIGFLDKIPIDNDIEIDEINNIAPYPGFSTPPPQSGEQSDDDE